MKIYTIKRPDIGKGFVKIGNIHHILSNSIGYIQKRDVGKQLYINGLHISMENDKQYQNRIGG